MFTTLEIRTFSYEFKLGRYAPIPWISLQQIFIFPEV